MADYSFRDGDLIEVEVEEGYLTFDCWRCGEEFKEDFIEPYKIFSKRLKGKDIYAMHSCSLNDFGVGVLDGFTITGKTKVKRRVGAY